MKVLMFGWEFPPLSSGGLGTACYGLTKGLSKKNIEITFVVPYAAETSENSFLNLVAAGNVKIKKIHSVLTPYMNSNEYSENMQKDKVTRKIYGKTLFEEVNRYTLCAERIARSENFDIIHCHDWMTFGAGIKAKKISKKKLIMHVHSTEFDRTGGNGVNQYVYDLEKQGLELADKVIAVSNFTKNKIIKYYGIPSEKIEVVHNSVDCENEYQHEEFEIKNTDKVVLFLGRVTLQKGPEYFINAAKKILNYEPNVKFVVAGTGDMEAQIIELSAYLGISHNILFAGFLNPTDVERAYKMADVYILSSVSEPFGITALEAMKNKTPIIVSHQSGVSEVVQNCLKVDFWDVDDIANKTIALLRYKELHNHLRENAYFEVRNFSWSNPADKCIRIYNDLINS